MKLEIEISELAEQMLGDNSAWRVEQLVEHEALRLYHIERSKPKLEEPKPVGRPKLDENTRIAREIGGRLKEILLKRKSQLGERAFISTLGTVYQEVLDHMESADIEALLAIERAAPWTRKWS